MAQTILNLITNNNIAEGIFINVTENVDGVETNVPYRIHGHNMHDNSEDSVMLVRKYAPVQHRMNSSNTTVYEGCEMDTWLNTTYIARYSENMQKAMLTTNIKVIAEDDVVSGIARKLFIPSLYEWGFTDANNRVDGVASPYTNTTAKRIVSNNLGLTVNVWFRSRASATQYRLVGTNGYAATHNANISTDWALPAFDLPSYLSVADNPNEDGTYNLLLPDMPNPAVDFTIKADESAEPYVAAKVAVEIENASDSQIFMCNNYNDAEPTWELADFNLTHIFVNSAKTAEKWSLGVRIVASNENQVVVHEPFIMWTHRGS